MERIEAIRIQQKQHDVLCHISMLKKTITSALHIGVFFIFQKLKIVNST